MLALYKLPTQMRQKGVKIDSGDDDDDDDDVNDDVVRSDDNLWWLIARFWLESCFHKWS